MKFTRGATLMVALALVLGVSVPAGADEHEAPEDTTSTTPEETTTTTTTAPDETTTTTEPPAEEPPASNREADDSGTTDSTSMNPAAAEVIDQALGDRFGQIKIDGNNVLVATVGATARDTRLLRRVTGLENITAVPTAYSNAQLQRFLDDAESGLPTGKIWAMGPIYEFTDTEAVALVHVTSAEFTDAEEAHIRSVVPADALLLNEEPGFSTDLSHSTRAEYPPFESGLLVDYVGWRACTTNFIHVNGFGYFGTGSGHCAPQATWNSHPIRMAAYASQLRANYYWNQAGNETYSDTSMWLIAAANVTSRIMVQAGQHRTVVSRWNGAMPIGQGICHVGQTTAAGQCSTIKYNEQRFTDLNGITHRSHDCMSHSTLAGDSGGAVYSRPAAYQAAAAGNLSADLTISGVRRGCFSRIQFAVWFHGEIVWG